MALVRKRLLATVLLCGLAAPLLIAGRGKKEGATEIRHAEDLVAVDCLLPAPVRRLGRYSQMVGPRKAIKTTAFDCRIRGGEYTENRADYAFSLQVWLPQAQAGDAEAQCYVGEIYEKGPAGTPDYPAAALWYRKAAEQGSSRAAMSLGYLYEKGLGVARDPHQAVEWYRKASGLPADMVALSDEPAKAAQETKAAPAAGADLPLAGPTIALIDPQITGTTRGTRTVLLRGDVPEREVIGRLSAPAGVMSFLVNDRPQEIGADGLFRVSVPITQPRSTVSLVAVDRQGKRAALDFDFVTGEDQAQAAAPHPLPTDVDWGRYYALVIGNNDYREWDHLLTAVNDAQDVAEILRTKYGFTVTLLENATRDELMNALEEKREKLTKNDNLLIYYAGHGQLIPEINRAYWIPVDGGRSRKSEWIWLDEVTGDLDLIPAKQVLVIADSCYSGQITRGGIAHLRQGMTYEDQVASLKQLSGKMARLAMTSGGIAPVLDEGDERHSVFAKELLTVLEENDNLLSATELYEAVRARVSVAASRRDGFDQVPQFAQIRNSRHAGGDFILVPKPSAEPPAEPLPKQ